MSSKRLSIIILLTACSFSIVSNAQSVTIWTEDFEAVSSAGDYPGANGTWIMNSGVGVNGGNPNVWYVSGTECGNNPGMCSSSCGLADMSLHIGEPFMDLGANYDKNTGSATAKRIESPVINFIGYQNITVDFNYIFNYAGSIFDTDDFVTFWFYDGTVWSQLDILPSSPSGCGLQGTWEPYLISLPGSADNNPNAKIAFQWENDDDGLGTDPSFAVDDIIIMAPTPPSASFSFAPTTTICEGECINLVDESTPPNMIAWNWDFDGGAANSTLQDPGSVCFTSAGTYDIVLTVTNPGGTDISAAQTLTVLPSDDASATYSSATYCINNANPIPSINTANGTFSSSVIVGGPFDVDSQSGEIDFESSSSGVVSITHTTAGVCPNFSSQDITINDIPTIQINTTDTDCGSENGSATATVSDGLPPYELYWSNGSSSLTINGLQPHAYYLNVTDDNNCFAMGVAPISSNEISVSGSITDNDCHGESNGEIDLTVAGGVPPYTYHWSNGATTQDVSNLLAGQYEVFVTDAIFCTSAISFEVSSPPAISINYNETQPAFCSATNGELEAIVSGGSSPFLYTFEDVDGNPLGTSPILSAIGGGVYKTIIEDDNGCIDSAIVSLTEVGGPEIILEDYTASSCSNDGVLDISASSIVNIASYTWSNGATSEDISGLTPGNYSVEVEDVFGCKAYFEFDVQYEKPVTPEICIVLVDTSINTNQIVWEKPVTTEIDYFIIYRESSVADQFLVVDTLDYDEESTFVDSVAFPHLRSWRYKLSSVNNCGVESNFGEIHKTMHITFENTGGLNYTVYWDHYEGINFTGYTVKRHTLQNDWEVVATLPATAVSFPDISPFSDEIDYIVVIDLPSTCQSTTAKATDYNSSRSNKSEDSGISQNGIDDDSGIGEKTLEFTVYPNPSNGLYKIDVDASWAQYDIHLYDTSGKLVFTESNKKGQSNIDIRKYEDGIYLLEIQSEDAVGQMRLVKL